MWGGKSGARIPLHYRSFYETVNDPVASPKRSEDRMVTHELSSKDWGEVRTGLVNHESSCKDDSLSKVKLKAHSVDKESSLQLDS